MKIEKTDNEIIVRFPVKKDRIDVYSGKRIGEMDTLIGLIDRRTGKMGFAGRIDRSYKGKMDDVGNFKIRWYGSKEELEEKCEELGIGLAVINSQGLKRSSLRK